MNSTEQNALAAADCEISFDNLTRQLYATDASIYQIVPAAGAAADAAISVTPRGAGSGVVGGAIGDGLIVEFSRHNRDICDLDLEMRTVLVGAGAVLDTLDAFLKPHGFCFGPDVATSSRASRTLRCPCYFSSRRAGSPIVSTILDVKSRTRELICLHRSALG